MKKDKSCPDNEDEENTAPGFMKYSPGTGFVATVRALSACREMCEMNYQKICLQIKIKWGLKYEIFYAQNTVFCQIKSYVDEWSGEQLINDFLKAK